MNLSSRRQQNTVTPAAWWIQQRERCLTSTISVRITWIWRKARTSERNQETTQGGERSPPCFFSFTWVDSPLYCLPGEECVTRSKTRPAHEIQSNISFGLCRFLRSFGIALYAGMVSGTGAP